MVTLTPEQYWALKPPIKFVENHILNELSIKKLIIFYHIDGASRFNTTPLGELAIRIYEKLK